MFSSTLFQCNVQIVLTNIQPLVAVLDASLRCLQLLIFSLSCNISTLKWRYKSLKAPRVHLALSPSLFYFISLLFFIPRSSQLNTIHGFVIQYTFPGSLCQCSALLGKVSKPPPLLLLFHSFIIWLVAQNTPGIRVYYVQVFCNITANAKRMMKPTENMEFELWWSHHAWTDNPEGAKLKILHCSRAMYCMCPAFLGPFVI